MLGGASLIPLNLERGRDECPGEDDRELKRRTRSVALHNSIQRPNRAGIDRDTIVKKSSIDTTRRVATIVSLGTCSREAVQESPNWVWWVYAVGERQRQTDRHRVRAIDSTNSTRENRRHSGWRHEQARLARLRAGSDRVECLLDPECVHEVLPPTTVVDFANSDFSFQRVVETVYSETIARARTIRTSTPFQNHRSSTSETGNETEIRVKSKRKSKYRIVGR